MTRSLAFDLDGTLVDLSRSDHLTYCHAMEGFGYPPLPFEEYWEMRRRPVSLTDIVALSCLDPWLNRRIRQAKAERVEDMRYLLHDVAIPSAAATLVRLKATHRIHVVTSRFDAEGAKAQLDMLGLLQHIESVTATAHADKQEHLARLPELRAVVGDTEWDVLPAKRLGVTAVAVASGTRCREFLATLSPDHLLDDVGQLPEALG